MSDNTIQRWSVGHGMEEFKDDAGQWVDYDDHAVRVIELEAKEKKAFAEGMRRARAHSFAASDEFETSIRIEWESYKKGKQ